MSDRRKIADSNKSIMFVPLNKLKKSPKNVRQVPHTKADIQALAASIAAIGMLQYPVVEPEVGPKEKPTGYYLVNAGEGRRLAQLLRAKRKEIKPDEPIRCILDTEHSATEISLAENSVRSPMNPADQYEAFAKLHDEDGMSAEDIAARFGVTAAVVRQRLKLGAVSPKLRDLYRKGDMTLDQLSAFAITEDHERQERVWNELPAFQRSRQSILRALSEGQVRSDDRCAMFIGAKAYARAGGTIIRDLFDQEGGGFFADADLLHRLVREKLQGIAAEIAEEGWRWIVADIELDRAAWARMRRVYAKPLPLSKAERKRLQSLQARYDALCEKHQHDDEMPAKAAEQLGRIEAAIEALRREEYKAKDIARAGAFVTLAGDGSVRIERGFVRAEDESKSKAKAEDDAGQRPAEDADGPTPLSEKLIAELTAYRTSALRNELAQHPATALLALVHALALATFFRGSAGSCLEITPRSAWLSGHAPGIDESVAERQTAERHAAWAKRLPQEAEALWTFLHELSDAERLGLLAHCVSLTANAIRNPRQLGSVSEAHAAVLAHEVRLDMTAYWQPTAGSYFGRVSKERIVEAMREGVSAQAADTIVRMKKQAMAEAAEAALAGKGWLPALLRPDQVAA
ncbi:ParB family chromosome partitioning protein [Bradyrhizobium macuxiense]|uniref:ParB family chromosome partitioning protein n=1 Tax=Bradyrhizobium macuxiense TaxID=1755647 RepID=A0A560KUK7_9BRAD|nr:ParB/RepB/Spo0J family partition protein [Bradyrhizobium macuxiense]TWB86882.1 ParB family chromosome partitioning protein [Bradyrhizobium macuxiense]